MLNEISETEKDKYCIISLICGIQKAKLIKTESRMVVTRGSGGGGIGEMFKSTNLQLVDK